MAGQTIFFAKVVHRGPSKKKKKERKGKKESFECEFDQRSSNGQHDIEFREEIRSFFKRKGNWFRRESHPCLLFGNRI